MKVLVFTNMYPTEEFPFYGSFVHDEANALRRAGHDVTVYFVNGRASKLNYLAMPFGFFRRLVAGYDIVHVHHSYCGFIATMQRRVPVVWTFHEGEISSDAAMIESDEPIKRVAYSKRFKRSVAQRVNRLIVVAGHLKEPLGREDAITLPSGLDFDRFVPMETDDAKRRLDLDPATRYILFPSSPDRVEKRYELARGAVDRLREGGIGDVDLLCLDRVPHADVPVYMNACELMLMTSAFEASPVTIREALSCNLPVLSTNVGDAKTILANVDGCCIVEPDIDDIAAELKAALGRPRRVAGRDSVEKYSLENTARAISGIYQELVHGKQ